MKKENDFERQLFQLKDKIDDDSYATALYCALCNMKWKNKLTLFEYSCTWRYAGGLVARIRDRGEDYLDYYCSGKEGYVRDDIKDDLYELGWVPVEYNF